MERKRLNLNDRLHIVKPVLTLVAPRIAIHSAASPLNITNKPDCFGAENLALIVTTLVTSLYSLAISDFGESKKTRRDWIAS